MPRLCADLYDALAIRGDLAAGRELWAKIFPIFEEGRTKRRPGRVVSGDLTVPC
ncbi:hypothetical protein GCM10010234_12140 [Streptomyces hawaiiensis]